MAHATERMTYEAVENAVEGPAQQHEPGAVRWRRSGVLALTALAGVVVVASVVWSSAAGPAEQPDPTAWRLDDEADLVAYADRAAVTDVARGPDGEVWAATRGGVLAPQQDGWEAHTTADGLPSSTVLSLAVSDDGRVWAGTEAGLAHLDDDGWGVHDDAHGPGNGQVRAVEVAPDGSVWAATGEQIARFDGDDWSRHGHGARDLAVADDGVVWTAAPGAVRSFDGTSWRTHEGHDDGPLHDEHDHAWSVTVDDGRVWVGTERGVSWFDGRQWRHRSLAAAVDRASIIVHAVAGDGAGGVWAATDTHGVWHADDDGVDQRSEGLPERSREHQSHPRVTSLDRDGGHLVAGVATAGVARLEDGLWMLVRTTEGLPADVDVRAVTVDADAVWAGTADGEVWRGDDGSWTRFGTADGLPEARVLSLAVVADGTVWAGTDAGLARFDGRQWSQLAAEGPVPSVHALAADGDELWVGTDAGVWHYDGRTWTGHTGPAGPTGRILDVSVAADGTVWAGGDDGVARYDGDWQQLTRTAELPDERVAAVARSESTALWIGFYPDLGEAAAEGVTMLEDDAAEPELAAVDDGVSSHVAALVAEADGTVWAAGDQGVSRHADGGWRGYPLGGLARAVDLAPADDGTVWVATGPGGLARLHLDPAP